MRVSKYMGQVKTINGICFKVVNYYKGKLTIIADQYDGLLQLCVSSWKRYEDGSETTKRSSLHPANKRFQSSFKLSKDTAIEDDLEKFKKYIDELCEEASDEGEEEYKRFYRKLCQKYHPDVCDHPNATELFKIVKRCWESITFGDAVDQSIEPPELLLLDEPKLFDLKEYCMNIINKRIAQETTKRGKAKAKRVLLDSLDRKGHTDIAYIQSMMMAGGGKKCARELLKIYHPDTGSGNIEITKKLIFYLK